MKHGGRVQIPAHHHNISGLLSGKIGRLEHQQANYLVDREAWNKLSYREKNELLEILPKYVQVHPRKCYVKACCFIK